MTQTPEITPAQVLSCPMDPKTNDPCVDSVGEYLRQLLAKLWRDEDGFSGKRPFGNSGWQYEVYGALVKAELLEGGFDSDGYLDTCDSTEGDRLIQQAINALTWPQPTEAMQAPEPEPEPALTGELDEYDVAAVVYCRTTGADLSDAEDRAVYAVRDTLPLEIHLPPLMQQRLNAKPVTVATVRGLRYSSGIVLAPGAEPYSSAGLNAPRKAQS